MFQIKTINPPAIIQYISGYEAEFIQEFKASATSPLELVMDYMQKRMDKIDETRRSFKAQYPDLLPAIA
jgi:hypothetical protein